jgi:hypothetical protein
MAQSFFDRCIAFLSRFAFRNRICSALAIMALFLGSGISFGDSHLRQDFWSSLDGPARIGMMSRISQATSLEFYLRLLSLDTIGVLAAGPSSSNFDETDILIIIIPEWNSLSDIDFFYDLAPPREEIEQRIQDQRWTFFRTFDNTGKQIGVIVFVFDESDGVDCMAASAYANILSGFAVPALSYNDC